MSARARNRHRDGREAHARSAGAAGAVGWAQRSKSTEPASTLERSPRARHALATHRRGAAGQDGPGRRGGSSQAVDSWRERAERPTPGPRASEAAVPSERGGGRREGWRQKGGSSSSSSGGSSGGQMQWPGTAAWPRGLQTALRRPERREGQWRRRWQLPMGPKLRRAPPHHSCVQSCCT